MRHYCKETTDKILSFQEVNILYPFLFTLILGLTFTSKNVGAETIDQISSPPFDKPLLTKEISIPRYGERETALERPFTLRCFYYPTFMIKTIADKDNQDDEGWVLKLSVTPSTRSRNLACQKETTGEIILDQYGDGGTFIGAKSSYLFLE